MYVLKERSALGHLVPFKQEHRKYETLEQAEVDATFLADVFGAEVVVVSYANDIPVFYAGRSLIV